MSYISKKELLQIEIDMIEEIYTSKEALEKFLLFSSDIYKYNFYDKILIYSQHPQADTVASMSVFNRLGYKIKAGTHAIRVFTDNKKNISYLFDYKDTLPYDDRAIPPYKWAFDIQKHEDICMQYYEENFSHSFKSDMSIDEALKTIAMVRTMEGFQLKEKYMQEKFAGSKIATQEVADQRKITSMLASELAQTIIHKRMNINPYEWNDFVDKYLNLFNTTHSFSVLQELSHSLAKVILLEIGSQVIIHEKEEKTKALRNKEVIHEQRSIYEDRRDILPQHRFRDEKRISELREIREYEDGLHAKDDSRNIRDGSPTGVTGDIETSTGRSHGFEAEDFREESISQHIARTEPDRIDDRRRDSGGDNTKRSELSGHITQLQTESNEDELNINAREDDEKISSSFFVPNNTDDTRVKTIVDNHDEASIQAFTYDDLSYIMEKKNAFIDNHEETTITARLYGVEIAKVSYLVDDEYLHLLDISVDTAYRRLGIGSYLMNAVHTENPEELLQVYFDKSDIVLSQFFEHTLLTLDNSDYTDLESSINYFMDLLENEIETNGQSTTTLAYENQINEFKVQLEYTEKIDYYIDIRSHAYEKLFNEQKEKVFIEETYEDNEAEILTTEERKTPAPLFLLNYAQHKKDVNFSLYQTDDLIGIDENNKEYVKASDGLITINSKLGVVDGKFDYVSDKLTDDIIKQKNDLVNGVSSEEAIWERNIAVMERSFSEIEEINKTSVETIINDEIETSETKNSNQNNFSLSGEFFDVLASDKERFIWNYDAIALAKKLRDNDQQATTKEQEILARFVGFGGLAEAFNETNIEWINEYQDLKALLSESEYKELRSSVLTAYYTPAHVIGCIYNAIEGFGFESGNILEPSMGTGHFFGLMPGKMKASNLYGVEIDPVTSLIAKLLYPDATIHHGGFETSTYEDESFDLAVGNVPFGNFGVYDPAYLKNNYVIHDYFFLKTLDKVREGGMVAFITSSATLDKKSSQVRREIAKKANLLGAIRLPNNTFSKAGTKVTTDILFLQKANNAHGIEPSWVYTGLTDENMIINEYFVDNPEMILGRLTETTNQFGKTVVEVRPFYDGEDELHLQNAVKGLVNNVYVNQAFQDIDMNNDIEEEGIEAESHHKNFSYYMLDKKLVYNNNGILQFQNEKGKRLERIKGQIEIRDVARKLINAQLINSEDEYIETLQDELSAVYDSFVRRNGALTDSVNISAFRSDNDHPLLMSLEIVTENEIKKADIFHMRTIRPKTKVLAADTAIEALHISMYEYGKVHIEKMLELTGFSFEELIKDLDKHIFCDPSLYAGHEYSGWISKDEYLSGHVKEKLEIARKASESNPGLFTKNIKALEDIQPVAIEATDISVRLGSTWIDEKYVKEFASELLGYSSNPERFPLTYDKMLDKWILSWAGQNTHSTLASQTYGTKRANAYWILENTLNLGTMRIYDTQSDNTRVFNKKESMLAIEKQELIKEKFKEWIYAEHDRRTDIEKTYNHLFNTDKVRTYDGSYFTFQGMNSEIELKNHQKDAIARIILGGNTLLGHAVGGGKSFIMFAAIMEQRRLGIANKPLLLAPKHLINQLASEFIRLYPSANILVATDRDFAKINRKKFLSRMITGDYDCVIMGHSSFEKIPMSVEAREREINNQIQRVIEHKKESQGFLSIKQLELERKKLEIQLEKLLSDKNKDDLFYFEETGIDALYVDESHYFKNLFISTKMSNVAGVQTTNALKSSDMYMKTNWLNQRYNHRNIVFSTGTPISNSMVELFTVQRYLQGNELTARGIENFDSWASTFCEVSNELELTPEGNGYRQRQRLSKFHNLPELQTMFASVADIKTQDMLDLDVPMLKNDEATIVLCEASVEQKDYIDELVLRAETVRAGSVDSSKDNMLKITNEGRQLATDMRILSPSTPDYSFTKVNRCAENIYHIYENGKNNKLTQLVFCDLSTPKRKSKNLDIKQTPFTIYDELRNKLLSKGIRLEEIAYIHDATTDRQRSDLFEDVRNGKIRVLIGSTDKMGSGTNFQERLVALHHLDVPWRPSDIEQREGRMIRQGNKNEEVEIFRYVTEGTFDSYSWQIIENKHRFIAQLYKNQNNDRTADDIDSTALSYAEIKAIATGNPLIKEKMEVDLEVSKLAMYESEYKRNKYRSENQAKEFFPNAIQKGKKQVENLIKDMKHLQKERPFEITVNNKVYFDKDKANEQITYLLDTKKMAQNRYLIGEYKNYPVSVSYSSFDSRYVLHVKGHTALQITMRSDLHAHISRLDELLDINKLEKRLLETEEQVQNNEKELVFATEEFERPFAHVDKLSELRKRQRELNVALDFGNDKSGVDMIEDDEWVEEKVMMEVEADFSL